MDEAQVKESAQRVWDSFSSWRDEQFTLQAIASPRAIPYSGKAKISGIAATSLDMAQARYTSFVSGKLPRMWNNFTARMLNGMFAIESRKILDDRAEQARVESLLHICDGWFGQLDALVRRGHLGTSWRELVADSIAITGKAVVMPFLQDHAGAGYVTADIYDPLNCAHTFGSESPWVFVSKHHMGAKTARKYLRSMGTYTFPESIRLDNPDDPVEFTEVWTEEEDLETGLLSVHRSCLINDLFAGMELTEFTHRPHIIVSTNGSVSTHHSFPGGMSGNARGVENDFVRDHARPFWWTLKHTHEQRNVVVSTAFGGIAQQLNPARHVRSRSGGRVVEPKDLASGGTVYSSNEDELAINVINGAVGQITQGLDEIIRVIDAEYNEVINPALFGQRDPGQSGFSQVTQISHAQAVFHAPSAGCAGVALDTVRELLHQFREAKDVKFRFDGGSRGQSFQTMPEKSYKVSDMPENPILNVEWHPDLGDGMQQIAATQQMIGLGLPVSYALSRGMNITNPQELMEQTKKEKLAQHPFVMDAEMVQFYLEKWLEMKDRAMRERNPRMKEAMETSARYYLNLYQKAEGSQKPSNGQPQQQRSQPAPPGFDNTILPPPLSGQNPVGDAAMMGRPAVGMGGQGGVGGGI
jgi:hypothetical protein